MYNIVIERFGIVVTLTGEGGGSITSKMKCSPDDNSPEEKESTARFNDMMSALESMILAHACAGIDIKRPEYIEGIQTACDSCAKATE